MHLAPLLSLRRFASRWRRRMVDALRGETAETYFDIHDRRRLNDLLKTCGHPHIPQECTGLHSEADLIWNVVSRCIDGRATPTEVAKLRDADPAARVKRVFELREDLRAVWPLALTPKQRGEFAQWLLTYGQTDFQLTPEQALWFLFEQDADPSRGLAASYRLHPEWQQAVPHGLTRFGWDALKSWVSQRYGFDCRWLRRATLPPQFRPLDELRLFRHADPAIATTFPLSAIRDWPQLAYTHLPSRVDAAWLRALDDDCAAPLGAQPGVNILGFFRYTSGLQQAVRSTVDSLSRVNVRTQLRDFPVVFLREPRNRDEFDSLELFDITILNTGIDVPASEVYRKSGLHPRPGTHRVAIWWWEMETIPERWHDRGEGVDEIWAPTRFIADAMRTTFRKPVYTMNPGISLTPFTPLPKRDFGLDDSRFTIGFVFDMNSRMQRKNPLGLIESFRRAFHPSEAVQLVLKVSPPESYYMDQWETLRAAVAATPNVTLIDRVLSRAELLAFLNACDAYASLHRSEGFGLTCAESMLLGKPVLATAYSGNLDFMTSDNSYLVRADRVVLREDIDPYPKGAVWAEPDLDDAARQLRSMFVDRDEATAKGARARCEVAATLAVVAAGERMKQRILEIQAARLS
jgi:glycosyltransferase involved in cell wall biosynthesis